MEAREFLVEIPIRPKAVQSTRFNGSYSYVDPKVKKWKTEASRWVELKKPYYPDLPLKLPCEVIKAVYTFAWPKTMTKKARKAIAEYGGDVPYISPPDLSDNINKGICDVLTACGIWEDDKLLWRVAPEAEIKKVYGDQDSILIHIRETPEVMLVNGKYANNA